MDTAKEKVRRRFYRCPKGDDLYYEEEEPDYYWEISGAYYFDPYDLPCAANWCGKKDVCEKAFERNGYYVRTFI